MKPTTLQVYECAPITTDEMAEQGIHYADLAHAAGAEITPLEVYQYAKYYTNE